MASFTGITSYGRFQTQMRSYSRREVSTASTTLSRGDHYYGVTYTNTGAVSLTLTAPSNFNANDSSSSLILVVKDEGGNAGTNNITVSASGCTIDGGASVVINQDGGSLFLVSDGTNWFTLNFSGGSSTLTWQDVMTVGNETSLLAQFDKAVSNTFDTAEMQIGSSSGQFRFQSPTDNPMSFWVGGQPLITLASGLTTGGEAHTHLRGSAYENLTDAFPTLKISEANKIFADTTSIFLQSEVAVNPSNYSADGTADISVVALLALNGIPLVDTSITVNFLATNLVLYTFEITENIPAAANSIALPATIGGGVANLSEISCYKVLNSGPTLSLGNTTGTLTRFYLYESDTFELVSDTNIRTITNVAAYHAKAPTAGTNVEITNGPYSFWAEEGVARFDNAVITAMGSSVASSGTLSISPIEQNNTFHVTGTTTIDRMESTGFSAGTEVRLIFDGALTVSHNDTPLGTAYPFKLEGSTDLTTAADTILTVVLDTNNFWQQVSPVKAA